MTSQSYGSLDFAQEEELLRLMRAIEAKPTASQRELAESMGVSLGKVHYRLKALHDRGLISVDITRGNRNKVARAYRLTATAADEQAAIAARSLRRKVELYEFLRHEIDDLRALAEK